MRSFIDPSLDLSLLESMDFLLDTMSDMVFILDKEGKVLAANRSAQKTLPGPLEKCLRRPFGESFPCRHPEVFQQKIEEAQLRRNPMSFELESAQGNLKVTASSFSEGIVLICQDLQFSARVS